MSDANRVRSIRQKLLNLSIQRKLDYNLVLIWYSAERLLYRLSRSKYSDRYILKGAMLFAVWSRQTFRPTKDVDLLGYGDFSQAYLKSVFSEIIQTECEEDGLVFLSESLDVRPIREEQEYGGQRISLLALLGNARIRLQIDVGFGDAITPTPQKIQYPTFLEMPEPTILAYSKETVIAEKLHALTVLGLTTSRMKDIYDLWVLSRQYEFDGNLLAQAIRATFERRKTSVPARLPLALTEEFYRDRVILARWNAFIGKTELNYVEKNLESVVRHLGIFFGELLASCSDNEVFDRVWDHTQWKKRIGQPER